MPGKLLSAIGSFTSPILSEELVFFLFLISLSANCAIEILFLKWNNARLTKFKFICLKIFSNE